VRQGGTRLDLSYEDWDSVKVWGDSFFQVFLGIRNVPFVSGRVSSLPDLTWYQDIWMKENVL